MDDYTTYHGRMEIFKSIGFPKFADYFKSKLWASIRNRVIVRDAGSCVVCRDNKASHVQHRRYDRNTLMGASLAQLFSICPNCKRSLEFDGDRKRTFDETLQLASTIFQPKRENKYEAKNKRRSRKRKVAAIERGDIPEIAGPTDYLEYDPLSIEFRQLFGINPHHVEECPF